MSWVRCFLVSIAIHILIVVLIAVLPKSERDPLRYLRQDDEVQQEDDYRAPVVFVHESGEGEADEPAEGESEELPDYASERVEVEPEMPGIVSKFEPAPASSEVVQAHEDESERQAVALNAPAKADYDSATKAEEVTEDIAENAVVSESEATAKMERPAASKDGETSLNADNDTSESGTASGSAASPKPKSAARASKAGRSGDGVSGVVVVVDDKALWEAYAKQLSAFFAKKRPYPAMAKRMGQQGTVWLELELERSGKLLSSKVYQSSGSKILDSAALDAVKKVQIPPFPEGVSAEKRVVRVDFRYSLK